MVHPSRFNITRLHNIGRKKQAQFLISLKLNISSLIIIIIIKMNLYKRIKKYEGYILIKHMHFRIASFLNTYCYTNNVKTYIINHLAT